VALGGRPGDDPEHVFVGGTARMAQAFDAIETVREVLAILEQQFVVVSLLRDVIDRGLHVAIGTETGMAPLAECALVVAPYDIEGERAGTIGVLGPTRMNYPQALAAVAVVSNRLSDRLTEG
jgi:heat-inducible transcriptional repressor